jgi:hypothetical protein
MLSTGPADNAMRFLYSADSLLSSALPPPGNGELGAMTFRAGEETLGYGVVDVASGENAPRFVSLALSGTMGPDGKLTTCSRKGAE